jgi:hypothetical protein
MRFSPLLSFSAASSILLGFFRLSPTGPTFQCAPEAPDLVRGQVRGGNYGIAAGGRLCERHPLADDGQQLTSGPKELGLGFAGEACPRARAVDNERPSNRPATELLANPICAVQRLERLGYCRPG